MADTIVDNVNLTQLESSVGSLQSRVGVLESKPATDLTPIQSQIDATSKTVTALDAKIAAIPTSSVAPTVDLSSIQSQIDATNKAVTDLDAKIAAIPASSAIPTGDQILNALRAALGVPQVAGQPTPVSSTGSTPAPAAGPVVDPFFPADPGSAKFPSPENSTSSIYQGKVSGSPYLRSAQGAIWSFDRDANGALIPISSQYSSGYQVSVNGVPLANTPVQMLMVRQGQVYFQADSIWSALEQPDAPISGVAHMPPPPPWVSTGVAASGQTVALPAMPPAPNAPAIALGSTGKVIQFGAGTSFATITAAVAAAAPGDTVAYAASAPRNTVFSESFSLPEGVTLDLGGRWSDFAAVAKAFAVQDWVALDALYTAGAVLDGANVAVYAHQLAGIVYLGNGLVIGARVKNFGQLEAVHGGTAGLRAYGSCNGTIAGKQNYITDCQNGIGPGGASINTDFSETVILRCGLGDGAGGAHCVYDTGSTVQSSYGPNFFSNGMASPPGPQGGSGGHALKSRAKVFKLIAPFHLQGTDSTALDRPDGSTQIDQIGAGIIEQCTGALNHNLSGYAVESEINGIAGQKYSGTTFIANCDQPSLAAVGPMTLDSACVFKGNKITVPAGAPVTGLPA